MRTIRTRLPFMKMMFNKLGTTLLLLTALCAPHVNADITTTNINAINATTANMLIAQSAEINNEPSAQDVNEALYKTRLEELHQNIKMQEMILELAAGVDDPVIIQRADAAKLKIAEYKKELADLNAAALVTQESRDQAYSRRQAFATGIINAVVIGIYVIGIIYMVRVVYSRFSAKKRKEKQK